MSKEKAAKKRAPAPSRTPTIAGLRAKIDRLDQELVGIMNQRAKLALAIGKLKNTSGISAYAPAREDEVLSRVTALSKGPLSDRCIRAIFRELISGSRALEKTLRVAYLGPAYSYSHLAAIHRFGQSVELVPVSNIAAVFEEIHRGHVDFGVVPIENSTDGRVADTLDMFARLPARICGEVQLRIHHNLLGKGSRAEVAEVYSKPQALSQCRNWLARHLPGARTIEVTSTTTAAQLAQDKPGAAAIASLQAGVHYGLDVLAADIEDNPGNLTRFAVIGDDTGPRTGTDKCALMFEVAHQPGSLADAMNVFKRNRLNLTWIESFPIARPEGGYLFFVELEGHEQDPRVRKAIRALGRKAIRLEVLGSYARMAPVE
ncbi:MAG: prephenate dehydratase [Pirellulales bacterium]